MNSPESQEAYESSIPLLSAYQSEFAHNKALYEALQTLKSTNEEEETVVAHMLRDFRLAGARLDDKKKKEMETIDLGLAELSSDFSRNLLESTNAFEMIIEDPADVAELPESDLEIAQIDQDGRNAYRFTLQMPSYIAYMTYGSSRMHREKIYKAYVTRAPKNQNIIDEMLSLRQKKAELLGFDSYASFALETRDADSSQEVLAFLNNLVDAALPQAKKELEELKQFALDTDGIDLQPYDTTYYSEKLKKKKFGYDDTMVKPYFEQNRVLNGLLDIVSELFGVSFEQTDVPIWHESIKVYDVLESRKPVARIYFDLEARKEKRGGAWMHDWETHFTDYDGIQHLPSAFVVANFSPYSGKNPSLLRHDDIVTLFHEMGHALHHLFSTNSERSISGINGVAWDVVEFPSQFLENFAYEAAILRKFAAHHQTGDPIPDELIAKIKESKNFQAALGILRQVEFSLFDFMLHQKPYQGEEIQQLLNDIRKKTALMEYPAYNKFQYGFAHIFSGGYAAGYYSYKWAEVFSAEAFFACLDTESGLNTKMAKGYRQHILSQGGLKPMSQLFQSWLGRKPSVASLMKLYEIDS
jgi:oligopeptidase A